MCEARARSRETLLLALCVRKTPVLTALLEPMVLCRWPDPHPALSGPLPRLLFRSAPRYPRGWRELPRASPLAPHPPYRLPPTPPIRHRVWQEFLLDSPSPTR